jgi:hypothetical protein
MIAASAFLLKSWEIRMMPNAIPHCEKLQHFVYLKLENKVIV